MSGGALRVSPAAFNPPAETGPRRLIGLDREGLRALVEELGEKPFRAGQLWRWIYNRGARDFDEMTDIAKPLRARLAEQFSLARPEPAEDRLSADGTRKWLCRFSDGKEAEAVHIPEEDRGTLCVSSQVGCTLTCKFCHTGTQRLVRNLNASEIVAQVMLARDTLGEWPTPQDGRQLSNVVMMGMGEPLYNYENVAKALKIIMDGDGLGLSKRRVTLSTAGVVPMIERCGAELGVNLAISLHAVTDELRNQIMPINKKYPLEVLMTALRAYPGLSNARRITFEYVMLKGINDSPADARALVKIIAGIPAKVNLIPFNPWPGSSYERSDDAVIDKFAQIVLAAGYASPIRTPRGEDILAACGQLKSASERERRTISAGAQAATAAA